MSQLAYNQFCSLVASLAEGRETRDIIGELRNSHKDALADITTFIVDNAVTNILRNLRRRTAMLRVQGGADLFAGHSVPAMTTRDGINDQGRAVRVNVRTEHLSKQQLKAKIAELSARPPRKNKKLRDYEALLVEIDGHCSNDETVEVGLRRARGY